MVFNAKLNNNSAVLFLLTLSLWLCKRDKIHTQTHFTELKGIVYCLFEYHTILFLVYVWAFIYMVVIFRTFYKYAMHIVPICDKIPSEHSIDHLFHGTVKHIKVY